MESMYFEEDHYLRIFAERYAAALRTQLAAERMAARRTTEARVAATLRDAARNNVNAAFAGVNAARRALRDYLNASLDRPETRFCSCDYDCTRQDPTSCVPCGRG